MIGNTFRKFTKWSVLKTLIFKEIDDLIIRSFGIVAFISFFVGGVVAIQTALNTENPLLPGNLVGFATRQSVILEFAPTFISIIMAGKVGAPRYSHDKAYCIIKGEWSMKEGVLSELVALGASKAYPNFSVLTKSEAQTLAASSTFTGE